MNNITASINIYHAKRGFSMFRTTDIETINAILSKDYDPIFSVGREIEIYDSDLKGNKKWKVVDISVTIMDKEIMLPLEVLEITNQGNINSNNIDIIVYVEDIIG